MNYNYRFLLVAVSAVLLTGCPFPEDEASYTVTVKNLTPNQPLSPLVILIHNEEYELFQIGQPSSLPLETLAESGDNSPLLSETTNPAVEYSFSGSGVILPSASDSISFTITPEVANQLSIASMLVNTNDAFVGETKISLGDLNAGDVFTMNMSVWDAGTEDNSESADSVPGPAAGGEGFNSAREDDDRVAFHPGVISKDDGLTNSALDATHRFLNPGAQLTITRTE